MIYKLSFLGWIQEEITDVVGKSRNRISEIVGRFDTEQIDNLFKKGKKPEQIGKIAEYHGLELTTAWAVIPIENLP